MSIKKTADGRRQRSRKFIDEKREKFRAQNGSLRNISTDPKGATFVILKNQASTLIIKERSSPTSKARTEASRNEFVEKVRVPERIESFREVYSSENRRIVRPGFVNPSEIN